MKRIDLCELLHMATFSIGYPLMVIGIVSCSSSTGPAPEMSVVDTVMCVEVDSTAVGACTVCNSEIATPYYSTYVVCDSIAHRRGMSVCGWAPLDIVPERWN